MQGIYKIEFSDGSEYIGQSESIVSRWGAHLNSMVRGDHHNLQVQTRFNNFGFPRFSVLEQIFDAKDLIQFENQYIFQAKRSGVAVLNSAHYKEAAVAQPAPDPQVKQLEEIEKSLLEITKYLEEWVNPAISWAGDKMRAERQQYKDLNRSLSMLEDAEKLRTANKAKTKL